MFDVKVLWFLIFLIIASYAVILVLCQFEFFRDHIEVFHPFESLLMMGALFVLTSGAYYRGYKDALKDAKNEKGGDNVD